MMLAAPPRAKADSLATSMTRTIAASVSATLNLGVSFISPTKLQFEIAGLATFWHDERCTQARKCKSR
jgi:hypothetical protein